ncbi:MAG: LacI family DNA-binding transcriptional regulator [Anaerolineae bacterium]
MSHPTIRDVAKKAGVGIGTVSRVLNNSPLVNPLTRQRVLEVIAELGFRPNSVARQLPRKTRIHNIGVITQAFVNYNYRSFAERLRGVQSALSKQPNQYELILYSVSSIMHYQERLSLIAQSGTVEGLIIIDLELSEDNRIAFENFKIPVIGINHFQNQNWPCIGTSNFEGSRLATQHLLNLGHTRIAYVGDEFFDSYGFSTSRERFQGYSTTLKEHGLSIEESYTALGTHDHDVARQLTSRFWIYLGHRLQFSPCLIFKHLVVSRQLVKKELVYPINFRS